MNNETQLNTEPAKIHVGRLIETAIRSQRLSVLWVAARLCCDLSRFAIAPDFGN